MKSILIVDTETTGVDSSTDHTIEVGAILWSVQHATTMVSYSSLVRRATGNPAEAVNGIPSTALSEAPEWHRVARDVCDLSERADAIVAHHAEFDRGFLPAAMATSKPWICTMDDVQWPRPSPSRGLVSIALAHGLGVASAHRALTDCRLIARLLERVHEMGHDVDAMLSRGLRPKALFVVAEKGFSGDWRARNELAKKHGFRFDDPTKEWRRRMAIEDAAALPFEVREVA